MTPAIRVRPVRGRVIDPFRGALHDEDPDRFADRAIDAQPLTDVIAVLERLPGVRVVRAGRRFTLGRGHDVTKVTFASAARSVSLADASFEGDALLALTVLHALLPLFGAIEVRVGSHRELIDGHEPLDAIVKRYETWWIDESLRLAKQLSEKPPAAPRPVYTPNLPVQKPASRRVRLAFGLIVAVVIGALWWSMQRAEVGEACTTREDCKESRECLPNEPPRARLPGGYQVDYQPPMRRPRASSGVCTKSCTVDADCPASMLCGDVISAGFGLAVETHACVPRAWQ